MRYELILYELDHQGVTNTDRILKETNNPDDVEMLESYAKTYCEQSNLEQDFQSRTHYLKFMIFENQDAAIFEYKKRIK